MQHILVIENQPEICALVKAALEEKGAFQVRCAMTGDDALPEFDTAPPDLVIIDILMPGIHGLELAAHACVRGIPLVLMTGEPSMAIMLRSAACPHLEKPFGLEPLWAAVRAAIDEPGTTIRVIWEALERMLAGTETSAELRERVRAIMEQAQG